MQIGFRSFAKIELMRKLILPVTIGMIILFLYVILVGCESRISPNTASKGPTTKSATSRKSGIAEISISPNPVIPERAVHVKVKTNIGADKVKLIIKGAEEFIGEGIYLKQTGKNVFEGAFIAPFSGTYPISLVVFDNKGNRAEVEFENFHLDIASVENEGDNPEELVREYFLSRPENFPNVYNRVEVHSVDEKPLPESWQKKEIRSKLYAVRVVEELNLESGTEDKQKVYYVVVSQQKKGGPWYIEYASTFSIE